MNGVSIFNSVYTGVFYATRRIKLDPAYMCFEEFFSNNNLCVLTHNVYLITYDLCQKFVNTKVMKTQLMYKKLRNTTHVNKLFYNLCM